MSYCLKNQGVPGFFLLSVFHIIKASSGRHRLVCKCFKYVIYKFVFLMKYICRKKILLWNFYQMYPKSLSKYTYFFFFCFFVFSFIILWKCWVIVSNFTSICIFSSLSIFSYYPLEEYIIEFRPFYIHFIYYLKPFTIYM